MTRRTVSVLVGLAAATFVALAPARARAEHRCGDFGSLGVVLAAGMTLVAGTATAATSAAALAAGNDERDYTFLRGFGYGELAVAIYSVGYIALDNALGCKFVNDADGYPLAVVAGGALIGALVPWVAYSASDTSRRSTSQATSSLALRLRF